jgi:hypothetical protein
VQKNLFGDDDEDAALNNRPQRPASRVNSEQAPYDPDTI